MSGHSKWKTIKAKKGKEDQRRASVFTKLARYITVAVKEGGSNPEFNPSLKSAIEKAKSENMPNDNIERAIKKGEGGEGDANYENVVYEGYGVGGVAVNAGVCRLRRGGSLFLAQSITSELSQYAVLPLDRV